MLFIVVFILAALAAGVLFVTIKKPNLRFLYLIPVAILALWTIGNSIMIVEPGEVGFTKTLGKMNDNIYLQGMNFKNPVSIALRDNIKRRAIDYTGDDTADGLTRNRVALMVDVTVPFILNPQAAPQLHERYGENWNLIGPASRTAVRDCTAQLDWEDAVGEQGRDHFTTCIPDRLRSAVIADLRQAGFSETAAAAAFAFPNALVRRVVPQSERILASVAEEQAALVDERRQETLTRIALIEANRRENDGLGIRQMMLQLPTEYTVEQMVAMIQANAGKTAAEALMRAVEAGNPNITFIVSGDVPVAARPN